MTRGLTVVSTLEQLVGTLTAELKQKAVVLGWCIELLQAYFLIADDLMDQSVTRRGAPCWYRMPRVRRVLSRSLVRFSLSHSDRHGTMQPIEGASEEDKVGTIAVNDSFIVFSCLFRLLKHHFRTESYYVDLLELFNEVLAARTNEPASERASERVHKGDLPRESIHRSVGVRAPVSLSLSLSIGDVPNRARPTARPHVATLVAQDRHFALQH